ncbi:MAG: CoA transferase [Candidatus Rokubacteria bacterium]|nr:CoA transferase [Candidatus Rokubacteria bacterium]
MTGASLPLEGVRVADISNFLAGPMISMFLGDYGAEVVKVENPSRGDEMRFWGENKDGVGLYYKVVNRNKKSITADLRTPLGVEIVKRLVRTADVVVENYRPGTLERWGLGYDVLSAINPGIVMTRITGFGQTGPYSHKPGFGTLAEGFAGYAYITGYPDRPPLLPGFGLADSTTGLAGAFLTMVALFDRVKRGGKGQVVDLAIYEPLFTLLGPQVVNYDQLGLVQERNGSRLPFTAPRNTFRTRDGKWVSIAGSAQSIFERICRALDVPHLITDPRFLDNRVRMKHVTELEETMQRAIERFDLDELLQRFDKHEAAVAPVNNVAQIFEDPHYAARQNITAVNDPELGGPLRMQNVVGTFSRTPGAIRRAGPTLGEHNRDVLVGELGFSEDELRAAGLPLDAA